MRILVNYDSPIEWGVYDILGENIESIEITDVEWDKIYDGFDEWESDNLYEDFEPTFALYLKKLIELARTK